MERVLCSYRAIKNYNVKGYKFGLIDGVIQLYLFNCCKYSNRQSCLLHQICGAAVTVGELVVVELCKSENNRTILQGLRIRDGFKFCRFGYVEVSCANESLLRMYDGMLFQDVQQSEEDHQLSAGYDGVIKLVLVGNANAPQL